jgi:hypothetical protein
MVPNDRDYLARKEHYDALRQEAERERLIEMARLQQTSQQQLHRQVVVWMANQLIGWGLKLQHHSGLNENNGDPLRQLRG